MNTYTVTNITSGLSNSYATHYKYELHGFVDGKYVTAHTNSTELYDAFSGQWEEFVPFVSEELLTAIEDAKAAMEAADAAYDAAKDLGNEKAEDHLLSACEDAREAYDLLVFEKEEIERKSEQLERCKETAEELLIEAYEDLLNEREEDEEEN